MGILLPVVMAPEGRIAKSGNKRLDKRDIRQPAQSELTIDRMSTGEVIADQNRPLQGTRFHLQDLFRVLQIDDLAAGA